MHENGLPFHNRNKDRHKKNKLNITIYILLLQLIQIQRLGVKRSNKTATFFY